MRFVFEAVIGLLIHVEHLGACCNLQLFKVKHRNLNFDITFAVLDNFDSRLRSRIFRFVLRVPDVLEGMCHLNQLLIFLFRIMLDLLVGWKVVDEWVATKSVHGPKRRWMLQVHLLLYRQSLHLLSLDRTDLAPLELNGVGFTYILLNVAQVGERALFLHRLLVFIVQESGGRRVVETEAFKVLGVFFGSEKAHLLV